MSRDRYRYFRLEGRELVQAIEQGMLELERGGPSDELLRRLFRFAHTLKGAARVVRLNEVGELAHQIEDRFAAFRNAEVRPGPEAVGEVLGLVDRIRGHLAGLESASADGREPGEGTASPGEGRGAAPPAPGGALESVRVDLSELDRLLDGLWEVAVSTAATEREGATLTDVRRRLDELVTLLERAGSPGESRSPREARGLELAADVREALGHAQQRLDGELQALRSRVDQARTRAEQIRLVPARAVFADLERAARDAATELDRRVDFRTVGGEVRLDAHVLATVQQGLLHLVRNAVAHGVEPPSERAAAGKNREGVVSLSAARRGNRVAFQCRDDGRGVHESEARRALVGRGGLSAAEAEQLPYGSLLEKLAAGGITTEERVSHVAGRGIGLGAAQRAVAELEGEMTLTSEPGRGTTAEIVVPVSLAAMPVLAVESGGVGAVIPLDSVRATHRVPSGDVIRTGETESVDVDGSALPLLRLEQAIGWASPAAVERTSLNIVLIEAHGIRAAVSVDRLAGVESAIVRSLPSTARHAPIVTGACLDVDGPPRLVLAASAIVELARAPRPPSPTPGRRTRAPILVIDDSLTTRMLEQSILESAGYEVDLATSGEEALEKARQRTYGLFVVDVEMPGMNGFELIAATRADAALREIPAIIVTSRGSREDISRGKDVGAQAYIIKGEFEQHALLEAVRRLIG